MGLSTTISVSIPHEEVTARAAVLLAAVERGGSTCNPDLATNEHLIQALDRFEGPGDLENAQSISCRMRLLLDEAFVRQSLEEGL